MLTKQRLAILPDPRVGEARRELRVLTGVDRDTEADRRRPALETENVSAE